MQPEEFALRLAKLRAQKGVSARDMSLSLGQNPGYINGIENGKTLPSMSIFFYICEYLGVTPAAFFDTDTQDPKQTDAFVAKFNQLPEPTRFHLVALMDDLLTQQVQQ